MALDLIGLTTTAIEIAMAATIKTKRTGSCEIRFNETGSTGIAVGPATAGEEVVVEPGGKAGVVEGKFGFTGVCERVEDSVEIA